MAVIYFVRHGQTEENRDKVIQGHAQGTLSELGREQARKAAVRLQSTKFEAIFSSDLRRAVDTATEIAEYHESTVQKSPLLRERNAGDFQGKPRAELFAAREASGLEIVDYRPPNGESYADLQLNGKQFLEKHIDPSKTDNFLIVAHGGLIRMTIGMLLKMSPRACFELPQVNACVNIIRVQDNWSVTSSLICCKTHL